MAALSLIDRTRKKALETAVDEPSHSWDPFGFALGQNGMGGGARTLALSSVASFIGQADSGFQLSSEFTNPNRFGLTAPAPTAVQETVPLSAPQVTQSSNLVLSSQQLLSVQAPAPADETILLLTKRVDTITGAEGNNAFFGLAGTVQSKDALIGGSGFNVAHLTLVAASSSQVFARYNLSLEKIEHVNFEIGQFANALVPVELSAIRWSGIEQVRFSQNSSSASSIISIEHLAINPVLAFSHFAGILFAQYVQEVGTNALSVILEDQSDVRLSVLPKQSFDRIDITSSGDGTNTLAIDIIGGEAPYPREMFLFGNAPLDIQASDREFSGLTSIDARNLAGGLTLTIANPGPITVQGGIGNDQLILTGAVNGASSFDGGTGHDTLSIDINNAPSFVSTASIRSVEHLVAFDALRGSATIRNSPDFDDILLSSSIDQGANLRLIAFDKILLGADVNGDLSVTSETPLTIDLQDGCDAINSLNLLSACDVTVSGNADFSITSITHDAQMFLRFSGSSLVRIQSVNPAFPDIGDLIDLSNLSGGFDNNFSGAAFSSGSDFLIGDFHRQSSIRLDTMPRGQSEIVFGAELHASVLIYNMGLGDRIDLGQLGVSDLSDLEISFSSGISHIVSDAFAGAIDVVGIDLTSLAWASVYMDFNGHLG